MYFEHTAQVSSKVRVGFFTRHTLSITLSFLNSKLPHRIIIKYNKAIMKKRDKTKQNKLQKITTKRALYEKARKLKRTNKLSEGLKISL